mgnify:CR=1 FL=1
MIQMQTAAVNTMRTMPMMIRLGPVLWASVASLAAMVAQTASTVARGLRRG